MNNSETVWIVDDDKSIRWVVEKALQKAAINTRSFSGAKELLVALEHDIPDALITDIRMPGMDGLELLKRIQDNHPKLPVIVMTAHSDLESAVSAFHGGAFEYLPKPFDIKEVVDLAHRACIHGRQQHSVTEEHATLEATPEIIGAAPAMQEVFRAIGRLAKSHITVLINGESGTGKELVAKALHRHSPRAKNPFIALNMAAIPKDLMESELFGHEKGAFTGAAARRAGRFEQANGGTLFLDEIGDMPAELQTRLLRVLADGEFYPVGGHASVKVDVRIIAATHQNLEVLVQQGRFREDLFHRLNVIRIHIPPLRDRKQDIPLLLRHFLNQAGQELNTEIKTLKAEAEGFLSTLEWPGNVRQLENICRWLTVMASGREIHLHDLPPELLNTPAEKITAGSDWESLLRVWVDQQLFNKENEVAKQTIPTVEAILIKSALNFTHGKRHEAAILLGYGRNTLTRKIKELGIED
ncbi:nitrogen regulation protein NR(I) [Methylovulum psychrotolerans]|jgi:two-component system nitrogen regulation response regulator GlnG|uniref:DNA-binding transcriptional regulator NtrC n=1 Tax=Methylovulum psychrotolerans TaxID=1704499 RepID=A0A1Z4BYY0_9GAMM|nr:nitrogen regulation protein NR(I) [Methylovulum psychrotolerans]ASF46488.1 nitrogen regulation protein NR(I) [Methylovulum psychrotolerans]MBT9097642.1 nitrogen regulation protein NR(I) [Methylovulum psychrotolerans]POZ53398.1 nitrogen regulation protein NR(I) [Methylovulum psychrotolerans]